MRNYDKHTIKTAAVELGISVNALAKRLELNPRTVRRYLDGELPVPQHVGMALDHICSRWHPIDGTGPDEVPRGEDIIFGGWYGGALLQHHDFRQAFGWINNDTGEPMVIGGNWTPQFWRYPAEPEGKEAGKAVH